MVTATTNEMSIEESLGPPNLDQLKITEPSQDWLTINMLLTNLRNLPREEKRLASDLKISEKEVTERFMELLSLYKTISEDAEFWDQKVFPQSKHLATDLMVYASQAIIALVEIKELISDYQRQIRAEEMTSSSPIVKEYVQAVRERVEELKEAAVIFRDNASLINESINDFQARLKRDSADLTRLQNKYESEYDISEERVKEIKKELESLKKELDTINDEYNHYVIVASTTPTYAWIPFYGQITGVVVASVYGDKAVRALARYKEKKIEIDNKNKDLIYQNNLIVSYTSAKKDVEKPTENIRSVQVIVKQIADVWVNLVVSLQVLSNQDMPPSTLLLSVSLRINTICEKWAEVKLRAEDYLKRAMVSIDVSNISIRTEDRAKLEEDFQLV